MKTITEETLLPISLVIVLIGGIIWLTNIAGKTDANAESIKEMNPVLLSIDKRLSRIEGKLETK